MTDLIITLERQERELVFEAFDHSDAWRLGSRITAIAQRAGHPVGIDIRRPGLILFRAALPGITPDQETWIVRAAVVLRMERAARSSTRDCPRLGSTRSRQAGWAPSTR